MDISRRNFGMLAAAAPLAVAAPPAIAAAPVAEAVAAAPVAAAKPWEWWMSFDGGAVYTEQFASEADALAALASHGEGLIAECQRQDFDLSIYADDVIERWMDQNADAIGEGEFPDVSAEADRELSRLMTAVAYAWARKHKINLEAWTFGQVRNEMRATASPTPAESP